MGLPVSNPAELHKSPRWEAIRHWAAQYGSIRLKEQVAQGYEGWPLYLHERLAQDFPAAKLDQEAWSYAMVLNPTEEELAQARKLANRIIELKLADDIVDAFNRMRIRSYEVDVPIEQYEEETILEERHCLVFNSYRPGDANVFENKTIRINMP